MIIMMIIVTGFICLYMDINMLLTSFRFFYSSLSLSLVSLFDLSLFSYNYLYSSLFHLLLYSLFMCITRLHHFDLWEAFDWIVLWFGRLVIWIVILLNGYSFCLCLKILGGLRANRFGMFSFWICLIIPLALILLLLLYCLMIGFMI